VEKRYTWRVFSALKWAFADFEDEYVGLDVPHISVPTRSEMTKELELGDYSCRCCCRLSTPNKLAKTWKTLLSAGWKYWPKSPD
jgi:hypothetical protein